MKVDRVSFPLKPFCVIWLFVLTPTIFLASAFKSGARTAVQNDYYLVKERQNPSPLCYSSRILFSSPKNKRRFGIPLMATRQPRTKRAKTVRDRIQQEAFDLIRDIIQCSIETGPRAGFARTYQAFNAFSMTIQDFLPSPNGNDRADFTTPVVMRKLFERLGATYIKLGQFIASSPTLFPPEYVLEFQKCLDATEPMPWVDIKAVIETELGPISNSFSYINEKPLASASIAQVHVAKLKTGEDVVIKVQKPNIDQSLKADLSFIYIAARVLEFLQPDFERTSLSAIAGDVRTSMLEELDFEKEATNIEEFRVFLRDNALTKVATAPRVYREFTTKKVLVMERLKGSSLLNVESMSKFTDDPEGLIITALNVWTLSVMKMPFFHADVHAGNLLVLEDGRVGFIDFGIVGKVSSETFNAVSELSTAMVAGDYTGMAQALCNMGASDQHVNVEKFGEDIERVLNKISQVQPNVVVSATRSGEIDGVIEFNEQEITKVMLDIVEVAEANGLKLPRAFGLLVKQSLYFDRYLKILAPSLDVMADDRVTLGGSTNNNLSSVSRSSKRKNQDENSRKRVVIDV
mmetsp:Transcript_12143/g.17514  ORF Transcript_12143/g.17514 Transcript_12143/m.17514 type:complete len:576 (-) Transcript_12143:38-1765(-)